MSRLEQIRRLFLAYWYEQIIYRLKPRSQWTAADFERTRYDLTPYQYEEEARKLGLKGRYTR